MITIEDVKAKTPERFWKKIKFGQHDECWGWTASVCNGGYGNYGIMGNLHMNAHRYVFTSLFGKLPKTIFVLHKCDNPACANPNHLFAGTPKDNSQDMLRKGRNRNTLFLGSKNGSSKLKESEIPVIRERISNGETQESIAKTYGVCHSTIGRIGRGEKWKHVE